MKVKEIREKTKAELQTLTETLRAKLHGMKFDLAAGKVKNVKELGALRRTIARILTVVKEKQ